MDNKLLKSLVNYTRKSAVFISAIAVLIGGLIYILFRSAEPVFIDWLGIIVMDNAVYTLKETVDVKNHLMPGWIIYSLPNGLWAFAYALLIAKIWSNERSFISFLWMASIPCLVIGYEVLQYNQLIPGTFCIQDLLFGIIGSVLGIIIHKNLKI